ncbi:MAG: SUMF1/EgtB/PvdO family nonheme iron enzyme, partial [Amphiplicatus sp.]
DNAAIRVQVLAAQPNAAFAEKIALALESAGYEIAPGEFDPKEVDAALVLWSGASIGSEDMIAAAALPLAVGALIPVSIGRIEPPVAFRHLEAVNLAGWSGDIHDPRWRFVVNEIEQAAYAARLPPGAASLAPPPASTRYRAPSRPRFSPRALLLASFALMAAVMLGGFFMLASRRSEDAPLLAQAQTESAPQGASVLERAPEPASELQIQSEAAATPPSVSEALAEGPPAPPLDDARPARAAPPAPTKKPASGERMDAAGSRSDELAALIVESMESEEAPSLGATEGRAPRRPGAIFRDCESCPEMATLPAGEFAFGSPADEPSRVVAEGPMKTVAIARPFAIGAHEVTFEEWDACVADDGCKAGTAYDAGWGRGRRPVVNVSYEDAQGYVRWLSEKTGARYRLPSEIEWEYAARAGTATPFSFGPVIEPSAANFDASHPYGAAAAKPRGRTAPVGSYPANAFGLYDMHGNVWEWVADCWSESRAKSPAPPCRRRVLKGGAWNTGGWRLRAAHRIPKEAGAREYDNGFRVVKEIP